MVIVDASDLAVRFRSHSLFDGIEFDSIAATSSTNYSYFTDFGHYVSLIGTGFSTGPFDELVSGTVTGISIDLDFDGTVDIYISGLDLDGSDVFAAANFHSDAVWQLILEGPTEIISGVLDFEFDLTGDFVDLVTSESFVGSDDVFVTPTNIDNNSSFGDAYIIRAGSFLEGGDDTFDTTDIIAGDTVATEDLAVLIGGDDRIVFTQDFTVVESGTTGTNISGDSRHARDFSVVEGGDDLIDLRVLSEGAAFADGDVLRIREDAQVIGGNDTIYGGSNDDFLQGDSMSVEDRGSLIGGDDIIYGGDGNDNIYGDYETNTSTGEVIGGNDELFGEGGVDNLFGNEGDDILEGGAGGDNLDGGDGIDTASYESSTNRVVINMATDSSTSGHATGDTFISIENLTGSQFGDIITGDGGSNVISGGTGFDVLSGFNGDDEIYGGAQDDFLTGGNGADVIDGGDGTGDFARYNNSSEGVMIDLAAGTASGGEAEGDTLVNIERLFGSNFDDVLTGDAQNNWLFGSSGDDRLDGGAGVDKLFGGAGADTFVFSEGNNFAFITDWEDGVDSLDLTSYGFASIDDALAAMDQRGAHTRFFDGESTVLILNADIVEMADDILI